MCAWHDASAEAVRSRRCRMEGEGRQGKGMTRNGVLVGPFRENAAGYSIPHLQSHGRRVLLAADCQGNRRRAVGCALCKGRLAGFLKQGPVSLPLMVAWQDRRGWMHPGATVCDGTEVDWTTKGPWLTIFFRKRPKRVKWFPDPKTLARLAAYRISIYNKADDQEFS